MILILAVYQVLNIWNQGFNEIELLTLYTKAVFSLSSSYTFIYNFNIVILFLGSLSRAAFDSSI